MTDNICGSTETHSGEPCQNNPSEDDGHCWMHTNEGEQRGHKKLSHDRQESMALALEEGVPLVAACRLNGITHKTHRNWMEKGEDESEGPYNDYFQRLTRALGHDQSEKTQELWEQAKRKGDTATMLTIIKQRYPETWQDQDIGEAKRSLNVMLPESAAKE